MKLHSPVLALLGLAALPAFAGNLTYVVVQDSDEDSLVRISADGKTLKTIANNAAGLDLILDRHGDYIVAAKTALLRVTRKGVVTKIANAPSGSTWVAVSEDARGNLIVADGTRFGVWRISEDGQRVDRVANITGPRLASIEYLALDRVRVVIDGADNYLLFGYLSFDGSPPGNSGFDPRPMLFRVTPGGAVSTVALSGVQPTTIRGMIPGGSGSFLVLDADPLRRNRERVLRLSPDGNVTEFARIDGSHPCILTGLAQNSDSGELITTWCAGLSKVDPSKDKTAHDLVSSRAWRNVTLSHVQAVVVDRDN